MSNGSAEVKLEIVKGVFDLLRTPWVIIALVVGIGMGTGVLTKDNITTVANKVVQTVKEVTKE
jgi:hypothetical protein